MDVEVLCDMLFIKAMSDMACWQHLSRNFLLGMISG
jgi:hypothetical protein